MNHEPKNRNGLTFAEFLNAAWPAEEASFGTYRTSLRVYYACRGDTYQLNGERKVAKVTGPLPHGGSRLLSSLVERNPARALRRSWERGEDPTDWRAWALQQRASKQGEILS